jgi:hypothetical protein
MNTKVYLQYIASFLILFSSMSNAQTCSENIAHTTPETDFSIRQDGTVVHNKTNLMWKVCSEGQVWNTVDGSCSGDTSLLTWSQSLQQANTLNTQGGYASFSDWRLPNLKELYSIVNFRCYSPSINEVIFNATPEERNESGASYFWTSTAHGLSTSSVVDFYNGDYLTQDRGNFIQLRLVRDVD